MTTNTIPALCQDCLRIVSITHARYNDGDDLACTCGGQVCACVSCTGAMNLLQAGWRDGAMLGLNPDRPRLFAWTADDGRTELPA